MPYGSITNMMWRAIAGVLLAASAAAQETPAAWKQFSIAPAGNLKKPLEKTVEWTFESAGSKVAYALCCPWLDVEGSFSRIDNDQWSLKADGISLKSLIARVENVPQVRIIAPEWMTTDRYTVTAQVSDDYRLHLRRRENSAGGPRAELFKLLQAELQERLQLKMHREFRTVPVFVLKAGENPKLGQGGKYEARDGHVIGLQAAAKDGSFHSVNANDFILLAWLQNVVHRPVIGAGLPPGPYRFELKWRPGDVRSLKTSLWEQLGLALIEDTRELEFLVVEYALKPEWR